MNLKLNNVNETVKNELHALYEEIDLSSPEVARSRAGEVVMKEAIVELLKNGIFTVADDSISAQAGILESIYKHIVNTSNKLPEEILALGICYLFESGGVPDTFLEDDKTEEDSVESIKAAYLNKLNEVEVEFLEDINKLTPFEIIDRSEELKYKKDVIELSRKEIDNMPVEALKDFLEMEKPLDKTWEEYCRVIGAIACRPKESVDSDISPETREVITDILKRNGILKTESSEDTERKSLIQKLETKLWEEYENNKIPKTEIVDNKLFNEGRLIAPFAENAFRENLINALSNVAWNNEQLLLMYGEENLLQTMAFLARRNQNSNPKEFSFDDFLSNFPIYLERYKNYCEKTKPEAEPNTSQTESTIENAIANSEVTDSETQLETLRERFRMKLLKEVDAKEKDTLLLPDSLDATLFAAFEAKLVCECMEGIKNASNTYSAQDLALFCEERNFLDTVVALYMWAKDNTYMPYFFVTLPHFIKNKNKILNNSEKE